MIQAIEKSKGPKASAQKICPRERKARQYPVIPHFPCALKKTATLLIQWIKVGVIPEVEFMPSIALERHEIDRRKDYALEQCVTSRGIFYEKHKAGQILFQEGVINIKNLLFLKHSDKVKGHVIMVSHNKMEIEKGEQQTPKGEPSLDHTAQQAQNLFKFMI